MRRLPVYLLLDTSGSMTGEPIEAVKNGVQMMIHSLRQNPQAIETAYVSIITFDSDAKQIVPLTDLASFQMVDIKAAGVTSLGSALELLADKLETEVTKTTLEKKGDWKPMTFIMTDGVPTDDWQRGLSKLNSVNKGLIVGCAAGSGADDSVLKQITESVVRLDNADSESIAKFFQWVTASISTSSTKVEDGGIDLTKMDQLPPPPSELVIVLLDTSGSMYGEPIEALNNSFNGLISMLRSDPQAMDSLHINVITFDREVKNIVPLTDLAGFQPVEIKCPESGPTHTGEALEMLCNLVKNEVIKGTMDKKGDWKPLLFIFTDGKPSDLQKYREMISKVKDLDFGMIIGCAAGPKAEESFLRELTNDVVRLDSTDANTLTTFFKWVSASIQVGNKSQGTGEMATLPPPPAELNIVV